MQMIVTFKVLASCSADELLWLLSSMHLHLNEVRQFENKIITFDFWIASRKKNKIRLTFCCTNLRLFILTANHFNFLIFCNQRLRRFLLAKRQNAECFGTSCLALTFKTRNFIHLLLQSMVRLRVVSSSCYAEMHLWRSNNTKKQSDVHFNWIFRKKKSHSIWNVPKTISWHANQRLKLLTVINFEVSLDSGECCPTVMSHRCPWTSWQHSGRQASPTGCKEGRWATRQDGMVMVLSSYNASIKPL